MAFLIINSQRHLHINILHLAKARRINYCTDLHFIIFSGLFFNAAMSLMQVDQLVTVKFFLRLESEDKSVFPNAHRYLSNKVCPTSSVKRISSNAPSLIGNSVFPGGMEKRNVTRRNTHRTIANSIVHLCNTVPITTS